MSETEVESILREIRERVLSQQRAGQDVAATAAERTTGNEGNGAFDSAATTKPTRQGDADIAARENLALINSYLTTTARAWNRLPPLVSNRSGTAARVELWLKRQLKRATRWYAWEQVNFNAAVHHALRDLLQVLTAYERELATLRAKIDAGAGLRVEFEQQRAEIIAQRAELRAEIAEIQAATEARRAATEALQMAMEAQRADLNSRLTELVNELRERDERLQGEQQVTLKQLALKTSEADVLEDRARRKTEKLLEELTRRVEQLERD